MVFLICDRAANPVFWGIDKSRWSLLQAFVEQRPLKLSIYPILDGLVWSAEIGCTTFLKRLAPLQSKRSSKNFGMSHARMVEKETCNLDRRTGFHPYCCH